MTDLSLIPFSLEEQPYPFLPAPFNDELLEVNDEVEPAFMPQYEDNVYTFDLTCFKSLGSMEVIELAGKSIETREDYEKQHEMYLKYSRDGEIAQMIRDEIVALQRIRVDMNFGDVNEYITGLLRKSACKESVDMLREDIKNAYLQKCSNRAVFRLKVNLSDKTLIPFEYFRDYLLSGMKNGRLYSQIIICKAIDRQLKPENIIRFNPADYYGVIYNKNQVPLLKFVYSIKRVVLESNPGIIRYCLHLHYWSRSLQGDIKLLSKKKRYSIGALALSLIIESASSIVDAPISFVNLSSLPSTQFVLKKMKESGIPFHYMRFEEGYFSEDSDDLEEDEIIILSREFIRQWEDYRSTPNKRSCIRCGITTDDKEYCGDMCLNENDAYF